MEFSYKLFKDGDSWCCVGHDFINLHESDNEWGATPEEALKAYLAMEESNLISILCGEAAAQCENIYEPECLRCHAVKFACNKYGLKLSEFFDKDTKD